MTDTTDDKERERCEQAVLAWSQESLGASEETLEAQLITFLIRERASVRAEYEAEIQRLRARVQELDKPAQTDFIGTRLLNDARERRLCTCDQQWSDPECTAVEHD